LSGRQIEVVEVRAPAKVNLFLEIKSKRLDGYHEIATLMLAVSLFDTLRFKEESGGDIQLTCNWPKLSTQSDNLVHRAAVLLKGRTRCDKGARIHLTKRIPVAAGLAGGSSDAAATLVGLNRLWKLGLKKSRLVSLAKELGSDVAFFFSTPLAWCTGRGEQVKPLELDTPLWLVLVTLPNGLSTAQVYRGVTVPEEALRGVEIRRVVRVGDAEEIGRYLHNRLEPVAEKLCPAVRTIRRRMEKLNPAGVRMSGSGTSVYALCRSHNEARRVARQLRHGLKGEASVFLVRSCN
jgi:4-diphosphocytidyl-2-C-methyl-D-erythritol kinase